MRRLNDSRDLAERHVKAVINRIKNSYDESSVLADVQKLSVGSIDEFLLADVSTMRKWVSTSPQLLQFVIFKDMYSKYFSNGCDEYIDETYNAYSFIKALDISVCPYCDDEYIDIIDVKTGKKRTSEIDHFFPKSKYPALAMCFYNLVPSGQVCNGLKLHQELGSNPHEHEIESLTYLYPDLPVGIALEQVDPETCILRFHPKGGMKKNVERLALEQRYERHAVEAHRLLYNLQLYSPEKIDELVKMGFGSREKIISTIFGPQDSVEKKRALRQKMLRDLTGY